MKISTGTSLTVAGLAIGILGVVSPIVWDWWNKRSEITVDRTQSATIVKRESSVEKLKILYDGKPIDALTKLTLTIKNTGRVPITKEDVITPLWIKPKAADLLDFNIVSQTPADLDAHVEQKADALELSFVLLNPGDQIKLGVLMSGTDGEISVGARIKNITSVSVTTTETARRVRENISIGVYIVALFSALFVIVGIGLLLEIPAKRRVLKALNDGTALVFRATSRKEVEDFVARDMKFLQKSKQRRIATYLSENEIGQESGARLTALLKGLIEEEDSFFPAVIAFGIAAGGFVYVFRSFFSS